jgi:hypothetical protein
MTMRRARWSDEAIEVEVLPPLNRPPKLEAIVTSDPETGTVRLDFNAPLAWVSMSKEEAAKLGFLILKAAGVTKIDLVN